LLQANTALLFVLFLYNWCYFNVGVLEGDRKLGLDFGPVVFGLRLHLFRTVCRHCVVNWTFKSNNLIITF
jgi:hypothetical protein